MGAYEGRHALIFAAAPETDYSYIRAFLGEHPDALIACADGGLRHARALGLHPDFMISDCDSMSETEGDEVIRLKPEKDDTDTMLAVKPAWSAGKRSSTSTAAWGAAGRTTPSPISRPCCTWPGGGLRAGCMARGSGTPPYAAAPSPSPPGTGAFCPCSAWEPTPGTSLHHAVLTAEFPLGVSNHFVGRPITVSVRDGSLLIGLVED